MRNLKKILALVLALVMSLSLMATAGASSFSDVDDSNPYSTAIDVLDALKVFIGYEDGSFQPTGELTRAEAAVLVYRIATGDVEGKYVENYTYMANSKFNDLDNGYGWAKGYINYCQNAEIIKGTSATTFSPGLKVTGYQLMVMVLRTLGYDKAGEFSDPITWELESARKCEQLGMLKNIPNTGDFGNAAPRQMTAEILFRGLLQNTVKYSVMTPGGYTMDATTLGYQKFTLEEVTGVVVANEYADLHRDPDLSGHSVAAPAGVTVLDVNGEKFNINVSSKLEDLGESRTTYTVEDGRKANGHNLTGIALVDTGYNGVEETGEPVDNITNKYVHGSVDPIRYLNFGEAAGVAQATIKFSYQAEGIIDVIPALTEAAALASFCSKYHVVVVDGVISAAPSYAGSGSYTVRYTPGANDTVTGGGKSLALGDGHVVSIVDRQAKPDSNNIPADERYAWRMEVEPGATYTTFDQAMVQAIFAKASWTTTGTVAGLMVNGQVFRGTQVADDYSDLNTYAVFVDNCVKVAENHVDNNINVNQRGWWLKVVDNDGDGITDYVFQTRYTVAKVSAVNAETGALTLDTWKATTLMGTVEPNDSVNQNTNPNSITANNYDGSEIAVGDVVYYAAIDGANQAWKCDVVEGKVQTIDRNAKTVKLIDNETVYNESAVHEHSRSEDIASGVLNMSATTNMYLYLDKYGNMAAFSQNIAGNFVLLTDGWAQTLKNGVEYAAMVWDRETQHLKQYDITSGGSMFIAPWQNDGANSWNRIRIFNPLNCGTDAAVEPTLGTTANHGVDGRADDVHTIIAYMEHDETSGRLLPIDAIYDVQRENQYPVRMLDLGHNIPYSLNVTGKIWGTDRAATPYGWGSPTTDNVRGLSNTVYYFVYNTTWTNPTGVASLGSNVYVDEVTGYAAAQAYVNAHGVTPFVEDVYTAATRAVDATGADYYTANVVVVELNNNYYRNNRPVEEVFIYDFNVTNNYYQDGLYIEEVAAIDPKTGAKTTYKIDMATSRSYTEADGKWQDHQNLYNGVAFQPGLYWLHRSSNTNADDIWYIVPMSHAEIRATGHYDVGTVITSHVNGNNNIGTVGDNYVWVADWACSGVANGGVHIVENGTDHAVSRVVPLNPYMVNADGTSTNNTRNVVTNSEVYYTLSYGADSGNNYFNATLTPVSAADCFTQNPGGTVDANRNQVLVRFDAAGNVLYAVSFAHGTATTENYAQRVWRNCLLNGTKALNGTTPLKIAALLGDGESVTIESSEVGTANKTVTLDKDKISQTYNVPAANNYVTLKVTLGGGAAFQARWFQNINGWDLVSYNNDNVAAGTWTVVLKKAATQTASLVSEAANADVVIVTAKGLDALLDEITKDLPTASEADKTAMGEVLAALQKAIADPNWSATLPDETKTKLEETAAAVDAAKGKVTVTLDLTGVTATVDGKEVTSVSVTKGEDVVITLAVKDGYKEPITVTGGTYDATAKTVTLTNVTANTTVKAAAVEIAAPGEDEVKLNLNLTGVTATIGSDTYKESTSINVKKNTPVTIKLAAATGYEAPFTVTGGTLSGDTVTVDVKDVAVTVTASAKKSETPVDPTGAPTKMPEPDAKNLNRPNEITISWHPATGETQPTKAYVQGEIEKYLTSKGIDPDFYNVTVVDDANATVELQDRTQYTVKIDTYWTVNVTGDSNTYYAKDSSTPVTFDTKNTSINGKYLTGDNKISTDGSTNCVDADKGKISFSDLQQDYKLTKALQIKLDGVTAAPVSGTVNDGYWVAEGEKLTVNVPSTHPAGYYHVVAGTTVVDEYVAEDTLLANAITYTVASADATISGVITLKATSGQMIQIGDGEATLEDVTANINVDVALVGNYVSQKQIDDVVAPADPIFNTAAVVLITEQTVNSKKVGQIAANDITTKGAAKSDDDIIHLVRVAQVKYNSTELGTRTVTYGNGGSNITANQYVIAGEYIYVTGTLAEGEKVVYSVDSKPFVDADGVNIKVPDTASTIEVKIAAKNPGVAGEVGEKWTPALGQSDLSDELDDNQTVTPNADGSGVTISGGLDDSQIGADDKLLGRTLTQWSFGSDVNHYVSFFINAPENMTVAAGEAVTLITYDGDGKWLDSKTGNWTDANGLAMLVGVTKNLEKVRTYEIIWKANSANAVTTTYTFYYTGK